MQRPSNRREWSRGQCGAASIRKRRQILAFFSRCGRGLASVEWHRISARKHRSPRRSGPPPNQADDPRRFVPRRRPTRANGQIESPRLEPSEAAPALQGEAQLWSSAWLSSRRINTMGAYARRPYKFDRPCVSEKYTCRAPGADPTAIVRHECDRNLGRAKVDVWSRPGSPMGIALSPFFQSRDRNPLRRRPRAVVPDFHGPQRMTGLPSPGEGPIDE